MVDCSLLAAEIFSLVWDTPANFNGFRVLAALLHGTLLVDVSQTMRRWTEGATYIQQGGHHVGHWPTFYPVLFISLDQGYTAYKVQAVGLQCRGTATWALYRSMTRRHACKCRLNVCIAILVRWIYVTATDSRRPWSIGFIYDNVSVVQCSISHFIINEHTCKAMSIL